jgi:hypothetical protein
MVWGLGWVGNPRAIISTGTSQRDLPKCIPTSQQPLSQSQNGAGREYRYETPKEYGGTQIKSVQQQTKDVSHPGQPHWEAGAVKTDPATGEVRMNNYERPKLQNDKTKVEYDE